MGKAISSLLFQPPPRTFLHPSSFFYLTTSKGSTIPAFHFNRNAEITILFSHGNAEDIGMVYDWFNLVSRKLNVNVMAYDYTGYGRSEGTPSEEHCYADIQAAFDYLVNEKQRPASSIVLYGRSLGTAVSTHLAHKLSLEGTPVRGLVLQSPLLSVFRVAFYFRFTIPGDRFNSVDRMNKIESPVFIIHGTCDEVVPFWHGQELFLACAPEWRAKPLWVEGGGHNNIEFLLQEENVLFDRINSFLDSWCGRIQHPTTTNKLQHKRPSSTTPSSTTVSTGSTPKQPSNTPPQTKSRTSPKPGGGGLPPRSPNNRPKFPEKKKKPSNWSSSRLEELAAGKRNLKRAGGAQTTSDLLKTGPKEEEGGGENDQVGGGEKEGGQGQELEQQEQEQPIEIRFGTKGPRSELGRGGAGGSEQTLGSGSWGGGDNQDSTICVYGDEEEAP